MMPPATLNFLTITFFPSLGQNTARLSHQVGGHCGTRLQESLHM